MDAYVLATGYVPDQSLKKIMLEMKKNRFTRSVTAKRWRMPWKASFKPSGWPRKSERLLPSHRVEIGVKK
jgi:hypothetical protein